MSDPEHELVFADHAWETRAGGKMLIYFGPHLKENLSRADVRKMVRRRKAWGAVWNYAWDLDGPWYCYVCDTAGYDIDKIKSKNSRKTIRRSLERCTVRKVEPDWLAEHGYETHVSAAARYENFQVVSREEFARDLRALDADPGLLLYGVFVEQALAAYGIAREFGQTVRFSIAEFDPQYSQAKPMYALYYTLASECLNHGFTDIDAGWRPFVHDTNIEEFFRRMGWRQAPCRIDLELAWPVRFLLRLLRPFREPLRSVLPGRYWAMLEGLLVAQEVARTKGDTSDSCPQ